MCRSRSARPSTPSRSINSHIPKSSFNEVASSQAALLKSRGDLQKSSAHWETRLSKVSPISYARFDRPSAARIGMDFRADEKRLQIIDVDVNPRLRTPVAQLNSHETRQAHRGEGEQHISRAILPGDRIRAIQLDRVDGFRGAATLEKAEKDFGREVVMDGDFCQTMSASKMLKELSSAASFTDPQEIQLSLSRDITNVLKPAEHMSIGTPPKLPRRSKPPQQAVDGAGDSSRSRSTSALVGSSGRSFRSASPTVSRTFGLDDGKRDSLSRQRRSSSSRGLVCAGAGAIERRTF